MDSIMNGDQGGFLSDIHARGFHAWFVIVGVMIGTEDERKRAYLGRWYTYGMLSD